jgi:hypothetical protein
LKAAKGSGRGQGLAHVGLHLSENFGDQHQPTLALEAFEEGGPENVGVMAICEILKEIFFTIY